MLSTQEALDAVLAAARPLGRRETVDTLAANGRVLAADVIATLDVPPMDTSAMDGYAVRVADLRGAETVLPVSQRIPAGHAPEPLASGTAARIFTGAPVPQGADAVVMQEQCEVRDDGSVVIRHAPAEGEFVNRQGADIRRDSVVLAAGTRLGAPALGLAASVGIAKLEVSRRLRVAVFFTGDELTMPGETLRAGSIYNSNRFVLRSLLENLGCEMTDYGIVPDNLAATRAILRDAARANDLIITSGGVSVGEEDHVKPAVEAEGRLNLWQIALKPGKPLAYGEVNRAGGETAHFLGLPGNPVSSFVTFLLFVRPFILRLQGVADVTPRRIAMRADFTQTKADRRNEFVRARINAHGGLDAFPNQSSAVLTSTVWGDGLIDNPPGHRIEAGQTVAFLPFSDLLY
ncbi:gephyrin-like molybdotransferase Glp [Pandoraea apista]|uniref:Molybdopterin molybdenumtransferase n=1 Tax=Pandoraea apista TaxID=93218 RepID=A0A0G4JJY6_9BURK|nr:gephyrin-like molybdotransferase Glp [Pandoraea apista]ALS64121.1 molybdopterin molybdenumtransferase MoeA [Pandoraea apista]OXS96555.1 molybdopterin molybdenumtransferase MoeA [Pandoraea apista]PTE01674.1 molybdopterin molybdenumtransferase MoeA [Pandoraea apista]RRJ27842.1 molybdopterin molybdenumtransferase MoeA [Pandoraea apista]RRJ79469.1 molybdopterin molybdenumtransferase MoeA [Pandoraea apista]